MGLTNSQYQELMRSYDRDQAEQRRLLEARLAHIYETIPQLSALDEAVAKSASSAGILSLEGQAEKAEAERARMHRLMQERTALLEENGYAPEDLQIGYVCGDCHDTGYIGNRKCHCFYKKAVDLFYTQSGLRPALERENFKTFSFEWYDDRRVNPSTGLTSRQNMHRIVDTLQDFIARFRKNGGQNAGNLLFYGGTGLGKTFLSNALARELIESAYSVIYYSSQNLFDALSAGAFGGQPRDPFTDYVTECDLLIIDDLGTEMTNSFVSARLFHLLNQRISLGKSMVISTNLSLSEFAGVYSERVFSRISSSFTLLGFYGDDIRIVKKIRERA